MGDDNCGGILVCDLRDWIVFWAVVLRGKVESWRGGEMGWMLVSGVLGS